MQDKERIFRKYYLIIQYIMLEPEGRTRKEVCDMLKKEGYKAEQREFVRCMTYIKEHIGDFIRRRNCGKNVWRYYVKFENNGIADVVTLMITNMFEHEMLKKYRHLGNAIQPTNIPIGHHFLTYIAEALDKHLKLPVTYQKFTDDVPYDAVLHPYCLKAFQGRWYLLAVKEGSEHHVQTFALDRIKHIELSCEKFKVDKKINVSTYFRDAFGIWIDPVHYPVQDITIEVSPWVANYLKTLPLHHSQKQLSPTEFQFHISPTPDFLSELRKWGGDLKITSEIRNNL